MVEAGDRLNPDDRAVLEEIRELDRPTIVAINKIDRVARDAIAAADRGNQRRLSRRRDRADQRADRREYRRACCRLVKPLLPASPALMPADEYTDQTERMIAEEIVREKIFLTMRQEIPFSTAVRVETVRR